MKRKHLLIMHRKGYNYMVKFTTLPIKPLCVKTLWDVSTLMREIYPNEKSEVHLIAVLLGVAELKKENDDGNQTK